MVSNTEVIVAGQLPPHYSAQATELVALTEACKHREGLCHHLDRRHKESVRTPGDCAKKTLFVSPLKCRIDRAHKLYIKKQIKENHGADKEAVEENA